MQRTRRRILIQTGKYADLTFCTISLLVAARIYNHGLWTGGALLLQYPLRQILATLALGLCWHTSLLYTGAYRSHRRARLRDQVLVLLSGTGFSTISFGAWLIVSRSMATPSLHLFCTELSLFFACTGSLLIASRILARIILKQLRKRGRNLRSVLIVGSNRRAVALADRLAEEANLGYHLAGFVDDVWHEEQAPEKYRALYRCSLNDLVLLLRTTHIDEVLITLPIASSYHLVERVMDLCKQQGIAVAFEASLFDNEHRSSRLGEPLHGTVSYFDGALPLWASIVKRLIDLLVSGTALILLAPLLGIIALAIKKQSPGPAFFLQERLGQGKRRFKILKFRTMVVNAESLLSHFEHLNQTGGPTFKLFRDPRVTPIGAFLRKTSLDELPQLLNVFLGDMSLVGPRPLPLRDYEGFSQDWHRRRFSVRPGITCIWQVTGRSNVTFEQWMELDMDYIDRWSLSLDLEILLKTIPAVIRGSGAA